MKAAVLQAPEQIFIEDVPDPVIGPYDALCQTLASAICSGTDNHIVRDHPYFRVSFPAIIGHEGIGKVISCGEKVKNIKKGDLVTRVFNRLPDDCGYSLQYGAFAELSIVVDWQAMRDKKVKKHEWDEFRVHRVLPKKFDPVESTMIITWRETLSFLNRMEAEKGAVLLIIGSGTTALSFANHARNIGIKTAVIGSQTRAKKFYGMGVKMVISYQEKDFIGPLKEIGYERFDIIIDTIGDSEYLNLVTPLLKDRGKIGLYGLDSFLDYSIDVTRAPGDFNYYNGEYYDEASAHDEVVKYIKNKKLNAWDYLSKDHIYPLEKIEEALEAGFSRKALKSVISFCD